MTEARPGWQRHRDDRVFGRFGYHPGLDGIRGLAVLVVVLFHAGSPLVPGGLLGVSVFFTLSGYLITRLLLDEGVRSGALDLPRFWARRLRRLLPAALVGIGLVLALSLSSALSVDPDGLRGDVFGALGYVANWRFLFSGTSYAQMFQAPSPLQHYWSLAVEEQFYLLFPLAVWGVLRYAPSARAFRLRLRTVLLVGVAVSLAVTWIAAAAGNFDLVYYSLPSRAGEILIGGLLATVVTVARMSERRAPHWLTAVGFAALLAIVVLTALPTPTDGWIAYGGLTAFAVLSAALIAAGTSEGPLASVLGIWPLRMLGLVSYGVYLYHWPVILWLTPDRTGLQGTVLVLLQGAVTLALAIVSYKVLERPIRTGTMLSTRPARIAAPLGIAAMALCGFFVTSSLSAPANLDFAEAAADVNVGASGPGGVASTPVQVPGAPDAPDVTGASDATGTTGAPGATLDPEAATVPTAPTLAFYGDSSGLLTAKGFKRWAADGTQVRMLGGAAWYGCGIVREGAARFNGLVFGVGGCRDLEAQWGGAADQASPQIAVILVGPIEVDDHLLPGDDTWRAPGDPTYDAYLKQGMIDAVDVFLSRGIVPVWLTGPNIEPSRSTQPPNEDPSGDPARMARFNALLYEVQHVRPELRIVDLARWMQHQPGGEFDPALRPDGVHFSEEAAETQVAPWLGPAILRAYDAPLPLPR